MSHPPLVAPLVSVVIPCFMQAHFLGESIESALAQTYAPLEVVVVDDGSPDDTEDVARRYPTVRYVRRTNGGLPAARNTGIANSTGELLLFLDSDDILLPHAVATGVRELMSHPDCGFTGGWWRKITADGALLPFESPEPPDADPLVRLLRSNGNVFPLACLYRRTAVLDVGCYDESFRSFEDWDLNLRIGRKHGACHHDEVVGLYRQHPESMSRNAERMLIAFEAIWQRERRLVRGRAVHEAALRTADSLVRTFFGELVVDRARRHGRERRWRALLHDLAVLARYYPDGIRQALAYNITSRVARIARPARPT